MSLFYYFHNERYNTCNKCYCNDWEKSSQSHSGNELIGYFYYDCWYYKWEKSECNKSKRECNKTQECSKKEIYESEDYSKYKCADIAIYQNDTIDKMRICNKEYCPRTNKERKKVIHREFRSYILKSENYFYIKL